MGRHSKEEPQRKSDLDYACLTPTCLAAVGQWCKTRKGGKALALHENRGQRAGKYNYELRIANEKRQHEETVARITEYAARVADQLFQEQLEARMEFLRRYREQREQEGA